MFVLQSWSSLSLKCYQEIAYLSSVLLLSAILSSVSCRKLRKVVYLNSISPSPFHYPTKQVKTLEAQHDTEVLKRTELQDEKKQLMDQMAELNTREKQLSKVRSR